MKITIQLQILRIPCLAVAIGKYNFSITIFFLYPVEPNGFFQFFLVYLFEEGNKCDLLCETY